MPGALAARVIEDGVVPTRASVAWRKAQLARSRGARKGYVGHCADELRPPRVGVVHRKDSTEVGVVRYARKGHIVQECSGPSVVKLEAATARSARPNVARLLLYVPTVQQ